MRFAPALLFLMTVAACARPGADDTNGHVQAVSALPEGYAVYKSVALAQAVNGVTGSLQLLVDSRITPDIRGAMWGVGPADFAFDGSALAGEFTRQPLRQAHLRLVDNMGRVVADETLDRPLADIDTVYLYGDTFPTYLVAVDYSSGCCNSGPATKIVEVRDGKLQQVMTSLLPHTIRADWHIVDARNGKGKEIEETDSNAEGPNAEFFTNYWTYRFNGSQWVGEKRSEKGYWEADSAWPTRDKFP